MMPKQFQTAFDKSPSEKISSHRNKNKGQQWKKQVLST
ncbi:hypothetical protein NEIFL0001_1686 [Neisseria flavescens SK114]|nr:hypothetical protein NEIFL0001_1686 [Neisseria flavescens SK114]